MQIEFSINITPVLSYHLGQFDHSLIHSPVDVDNTGRNITLSLFGQTLSASLADSVVSDIAKGVSAYSLKHNPVSVVNTDYINLSITANQQLSARINENGIQLLYEGANAFSWGDHRLAGYITSSLIGVAGGLVPLDDQILIPSVYLPSFVDDVVEVDNFNELPEIGESSKIYITLNDIEVDRVIHYANTQYRWSGSRYIELVASPGSSDNVPEGVMNLYYSDSRVQSFSDSRYSFSDHNHDNTYSRLVHNHNGVYEPSFGYSNFLDQAVKTTSTPQFTRLGIGTSAHASYSLNVNGDINIPATGQLRANGSGFFGTNGANLQYGVSSQFTSHYFYIGGTAKHGINSTGFGVGTITPDKPFTFVDGTDTLKFGKWDTGGYMAIWFNQATPSNGNYGFLGNSTTTQFNASSQIFFNITDSTIARITSTGFGIGITPSTNFHIAASNSGVRIDRYGNYGGYFDFWQGANSGSVTRRWLIQVNPAGNVTADDDLRFYSANKTGGADYVMTLERDGNVRIGYSASQGTYKLQVNGNATFGGFIAVGTSVIASGGQFNEVYADSSSHDLIIRTRDNSTSKSIVFKTGDTTVIEKMRLDKDGNLLIGNTNGTEKLSVTGNIIASGYKSSDGSAGVSGTWTTTDGKTITAKNGLITQIA